ncbi:hypothetical protein SKAU_G00209510 [Synaphobranchus kaupii]|uniref:BESS domain-containing protein n=1 Tax=Synaphobranchus kaupii TaxID=118154 RepID=A0A9Q1F8M3_SYNKA|nr:hypothetical protein SKAU_G00209510 [Synaphobranchus kaupii]
MDRKRSGAGATSHKRWKYMNILGFLEPHCRERATTSNLVVVQGGEGGEVSGEIMALLGPMMSPQREVVESEEEAAGPSAHPSEDPSRPSARLSEDPSADTSPPSPPRTSTRVQETPNRKRKSTQTLTLYQKSVLSVLERQTDEDEHFMMSLVPSLRRLSNQKKAQVRMRFEQVLYDVEFGEM